MALSALLPFIDPIVKTASSALGFGSSMMASNGRLKSQRRQYEYQSKLNEQQFGYQQKLNTQQFGYTKSLQDLQNQFYLGMSNTAHQREMADLKAAGLNPILAANGGASSAMGAVGSISSGSAQGGTAALVDTGDDVFKGIQSALAFRQQRNMNKSTDSQVELNGSQRDLNVQNEHTSKKQESLLGEQARNEAERFDNIIADRMKTLQDIENSKALTSAQVTNLIKQGDAAITTSEAAKESASAKTLHQYLGKWTEDKFQSLKNSQFGKDLAKLGRKIYQR